MHRIIPPTLTYPPSSTVFPLVHNPPPLLPPLLHPPLLFPPRSHRCCSVDCYTGTSVIPLFLPSIFPLHLPKSYPTLSYPTLPYPIPSYPTILSMTFASLNRGGRKEGIATSLTDSPRVYGSNKPTSSSFWARVRLSPGSLWRGCPFSRSIVGFWVSWLGI